MEMAITRQMVNLQPLLTARTPFHGPTAQTKVPIPISEGMLTES